ncbi:MAG: hypothetical protein KAS32_18280, partial [Candidatus Peribacteraceae bacterium]|nr:hypothetical protein [Candidatus Peribacteraceae bacterium]
FEDPAARLIAMQAHLDSRSIGWVGLDMITEQCRRGELFMVAGNSGSGKSVVLANIAVNMAEDKQNALIISLELGEDLVTKRMDGIVTEIPQKEIFESIEEVVELLDAKKEGYGSIHVKRMPSGTRAMDIRAYLMEYEIQFGYKPDVMCVDYLDLMGTDERPSDSGIFALDKQRSEELREIFVDYNAYGFTASQLNRDAIDTEHKSQAHIAGGLSKINTIDVGFAITRDEEQQDNGEIHLSALKLRNASFSHAPVVLYWDDATLKITEKTGSNKPKQPSSQQNKVVSGNRQRLNKVIGNSKKP